MNCAVSFMKYGVLLFNFVLMGLGAALVMLECSQISSINELMHLQQFVNSTSLVSKILLVTGLIMLIFAFSGCWGAFQESTLLLYWYAFLLMILIFLQVVSGLYVYLNRDSVQDVVERDLRLGLNEYNKTDTKNVIDSIQSKYKCCGLNDPSDWEKNGQEIPPSCCPESDQQTCSLANVYPKGCLKINIVKNISASALWVIIGILTFEVLLLLFTLTVRSSIRDSLYKSRSLEQVYG